MLFSIVLFLFLFHKLIDDSNPWISLTVLVEDGGGGGGGTVVVEEVGGDAVATVFPTCAKKICVRCLQVFVALCNLSFTY